MTATVNTVPRLVVAALLAAGLTKDSDTSEIKKAYFTTTGKPLTKSNLSTVLLALGGDEASISDEAAPAATTTKAKGKPAAAPKEPKPAAAPKVTETKEQMLARLKQEKPERFGRVTEILEVGKKGPTRVRILCEDKGTNGEDLYRDIKIQDLFQVRFSAGYKKPRKAAAAAPASETAAS
jgi:hypothetical protein